MKKKTQTLLTSQMKLTETATRSLIRPITKLQNMSNFDGATPPAIQNLTIRRGDQKFELFSKVSLHKINLPIAIFANKE